MNLSEAPAPVERIYDLNRLSDAGYETSIALSGDDCARLAQWAMLDAVERFEAKISVKRLSQSRFAYAAKFESDIVQSCAVTLEPVPATISLEFTRSLYLVPYVKKSAEVIVEVGPASGEDDVPEEIYDPRFDLAMPVLEEFLLAIDPYPRAPGVEFAVSEEAGDKPESPFAILKRLKSEG